MRTYIHVHVGHVLTMYGNAHTTSGVNHLFMKDSSCGFTRVTTGVIATDGSDSEAAARTPHARQGPVKVVT